MNNMIYNFCIDKPIFHGPILMTAVKEGNLSVTPLSTKKVPYGGKFAIYLY